ncbi:MAG: hypothetical protein LBB85_10295 [Dysgonamonadaceae bacterium]|jgi:hypothetical protein|nr:hypothetical protein [Dysgonamonadaceae bacterium]
MKKITFLYAAFLMVVLGATAQTQINNPKDADGYYIVKWDCKSNTWAASNNFEVDEAFTIAIDVTGTPLEDWLKGTPTNAGATRSIAVNKWTGFGNVSGDSHRMKQIRGNIYGATWAITQLGTADFDLARATTAGEICYVYGQVFGFEYTADNPGAAWWLWPAGMVEGASIAGPGDAFFCTAPYTGTKTSDEFYNDDFGNELFGDAYPVKGYAPSCAVATTAIPAVISNAEAVAREYYNLQGVKLGKEPESGLYIERAILSNGERVSTKMVKAWK